MIGTVQISHSDIGDRGESLAPFLPHFLDQNLGGRVRVSLIGNRIINLKKGVRTR